MGELSEQFGRRVRSLRRAKGLTQEELGKAVSLDYKFIGNIERGEKAPSFPAIERIAAALGVEYHELFLPDRLSTQELRERLRSAKGDVQKLDGAALERFLQDMISAVRRLEGGRHG